MVTSTLRLTTDMWLANGSPNSDTSFALPTTTTDKTPAKGNSLNVATITYGNDDAITITCNLAENLQLYIDDFLPYMTPVELEIPEGITVYEFDRYESGTLYVKGITGNTILANQPVILKAATAGNYTFDFAGTNTTSYVDITSSGSIGNDQARLHAADAPYNENGTNTAENAYLYGVFIPHLTPLNSYYFDSTTKSFVPAPTRTATSIPDGVIVIEPFNCYVTLPEVDSNVASINIVFPDPGYYLGGALTAQFDDDPNPSYMFSKTEEGTYTLDVASIPAGTTFYVIYCDDDGNLTYYGSNTKADKTWDYNISSELNLDLGDLSKEEGEDGALNSIGLGSNENPASYLNVIFTLTLDGTTPSTLSYTGTLESAGFNLTVGNDKTTQSGTISGQDITMDTEKEAATIFIYVPEGSSDVQYALDDVSDIGDATALSTYADVPANLEWKNANASNYETGAYEANLPTGTTGTLYVKYTNSDDEEITSDPYTFTVNYAVPTAIESIDTDQNEAPIYNVFGQRVDESYRGIVIKNGKKFIQR